MIRSKKCDVVLIALGAVLSLASATVRAEPNSSANLSDAQALFKRAIERLEAGDFAAACPMFEASFASTPSVGAKLNVARCHERDGALATAFRDYQRALELSRDTKDEARRATIVEVVDKAVSALEPRLPRMRVSVPSPPPGLRMTRDGADLPSTLLDQEVPLDPGQHELRASAPGYVSVSRTVLLEEGKTTPVILVFVPEPVDTEPRPAVVRPTLPAAVAPAPTQPLPPPAPAGTSVPTWAWVAGGAGFALVGAGAFFLADDLAAIRALRAHCPSTSVGTQCAPGYDYQADNARKNRDMPLAIGLGSAGIAALGAAGTGIARGISLRSRRGSPAITASPWATADGAGASLWGRF
jgi:hypothetical protein